MLHSLPKRLIKGTTVVNLLYIITIVRTTDAINKSRVGHTNVTYILYTDRYRFVLLRLSAWSQLPNWLN